MEASSPKSVYLTYVTDAGDSWRFLEHVYALSSISPETRFRSAMTQYEPGYVYRDEKTFVLEEYALRNSRHGHHSSSVEAQALV